LPWMSGWISEEELMKKSTKMENTRGEHAGGDGEQRHRGVHAGTMYRAQDDPESDCVVVLQGPYNN
jgi:hypothetical protein